MGCKYGNGHERVHSAEARRKREEMKCFSQVARVVARAVHLKTENPTSTRHLFHCQSALRVTLHEWVVHTSDPTMPGQELRDPERIFVLPLHSHRQCFSSAQQQKRGMWIHAATERGSALVDGLNQVAPARNDSADQIGMPAQILGSRVHHQI